ncbi:hypothetical protein cyc_08888 [Cyclospora cayetanensis]|uniref:Uncharacterized protein n=1 Tax=Cyclospora cayetanensis TaxID=88456 RepID=A0A1D3D2Y6_9EIME|nr:hypothetical protein cyc_08888 [Cyclospora cayetanensis]
MKATSTEALGGLADRAAAENMLEEKENTDISVAQKAEAVAEKELSQIRAADKRAEEREEEFAQQRISEEEDLVKHEEQLAKSLVAEEKKLSDTLEEELSVLEAEVGATKADEKDAEAHLDAVISEANGSLTSAEAAERVEKADEQAEKEKANIKKHQAERVAGIVRHLANEGTEKLDGIVESAEENEEPVVTDSIGEVEAKVLTSLRETEEEELQPAAKELATNQEDDSVGGIKKVGQELLRRISPSTSEAHTPNPEEGNDDVPDLWFGSEGQDQTDEGQKENKENLAWWQHMLG